MNRLAIVMTLEVAAIALLALYGPQIADWLVSSTIRAAASMGSPAILEAILRLMGL